MEKGGALRTILLDGNDVDRYVYSDQTDNRFPEQTDPLCYQKSECSRKTSASSDTDPNVLKNVEDGNWHQLVLTTREDGAKGYNLYVDSVLQASSPYVEGIGIDRGFSDPNLYVNWAGVGGEPIDPIGPIRFCGRAKPAGWSDGPEDEWEWDAGRYFRGQVAHFAVWDSALSQEGVQNLHTLYYNQYFDNSTSTDNNVNKAKSTDDDDDDDDDGLGLGDGGLGTGAIAGIVVGSVVGVVLLAGAGWYGMKQKAGDPELKPNDVANIT